MRRKTGQARRDIRNASQRAGSTRRNGGMARFGLPFPPAVKSFPMKIAATWWFAFRGQELLVRVEEHAATLPDAEELEALGLSGSEPIHVGERSYAVGLEPELPPPPEMTFLGLRKLWGRLDEEAWKLAGRAVQLVEWDRNHRFCGKCGTPTVAKAEERSRTCPSCGLQHFPRISPAVITLVEDDDGRVLLARSPHFVPGVYSTLAGFVEPGESLEETVAREVREEVGVEVRDVRYFGPRADRRLSRPARRVSPLTLRRSPPPPPVPWRAARPDVSRRPRDRSSPEAGKPRSRRGWSPRSPAPARCP